MTGIRIDGKNLDIDLGKDFRHAPLGRLSNRMVELGRGGLGRTGRQTYTAPKKHLFSRFLDWLTPKGWRVEGKVKRCIEGFSGKLGNTLGALYSGEGKPVDAEGFLKGLSGMREQAEALTKRGGEYRQLLQKRLEVNFSNLTNDELLGLHRGLNSKEMTQVGQYLKNGPSEKEKAIQEAMEEFGIGHFDHNYHAHMRQDMGLISSTLRVEISSRRLEVGEGLQEHISEESGKGKWAEKPYDKPRSVEDILGGGNEQLLKDFIGLTEERQDSESTHFWLAVQEFKKNPTVEGARQIHEKFIRPEEGLWGSEDERTPINLYGNVREPITKEVTDLEDDSDVDGSIFDVALDVVHDSLKIDFKAFLEMAEKD